MLLNKLIEEYEPGRGGYRSPVMGPHRRWESLAFEAGPDMAELLAAQIKAKKIPCVSGGGMNYVNGRDATETRWSFGERGSAMTEYQEGVGRDA